jgi:hypothetical protein
VRPHQKLLIHIHVYACILKKQQQQQKPSWQDQIFYFYIHAAWHNYWVNKTSGLPQRKLKVIKSYIYGHILSLRCLRQGDILQPQLFQGLPPNYSRFLSSSPSFVSSVTHLYQHRWILFIWYDDKLSWESCEFE